jgi:tetratricopeptide (TPR) repeat protein
MSTYKAVRKSSFDRLIDAIVKNMYQISIVVSILLISSGVFYGYTIWKEYANQNAQKYFSSLIIEYNQGRTSEQTDWEALLKKFEKGYENNSNASLLPYYKGYMVAILDKLNRKEEAQTLLKTIISEIQFTPMRALYDFELGLMLLDSSDSDLQSRGEKIVRTLAGDSTSIVYDAALFYLGRYYWAHDNIAAAHEAWQMLVDSQRDAKVAPSPWLEQAKEYLALSIVH